MEDIRRRGIAPGTASAGATASSAVEHAARDRYLSPDEAAAYLNVSVGIVRRIASERRVRHFRLKRESGRWQIRYRTRDGVRVAWPETYARRADAVRVLAAVREWRATLLKAGISPTMVAKSYRLMRAILNTAVTEDELIIVNPCRIKAQVRNEPASGPC